MPIIKEFDYASRDGINRCHAYTMEPDDGNIKAIYQIVHGMNEYISRYRDFAEFLCSHGFMVVGNDHLGHGRTVSSDKDLGYFADKNADTILVRDVHRLKKTIQAQHPGIPYFIMGHSMGSFIFRKYLTMYGKGITGGIVMGTGVMPAAVTGCGIFLTNFLKLFCGDRHVSGLIKKIAFGAYNKNIPNARTANDWLTRDNAIVDRYNADPWCTFSFTLNGYRTLFQMLSYDCKTKNLKTIPAELPILVMSGADDPVGNYGKGPQAVYEQYKTLGIKDVQLKLYPECRHEILNELNRQECYDDILSWLEAHI